VIGFCLAAGAGSRLAPLTRVTPKPLLAPAGRPLIDLAVEALQAAGATRVVVNAHHGADQLAAHLAGRPGVDVVVEPVLLGTGGGLVNAAHLGLLGGGDDAVLVTAADHVVDPADLADLAAFLERSGAPMVAGMVPATMDPFRLRIEGPAAQPEAGLWTTADPPRRAEVRSPSGGPAAAARGSSVPAGRGAGMAGGWVVRDPGGPWESAGAYCVRVELLRELEPGPATLVGRVLGPLLEGGRLGGLPLRGPLADAGTLERLLRVSAGLLAGRWPSALPPGRLLGDATAGEGRGAGCPAVVRGPVFVADGAEVDPAAVLAGPVVLDAGCRVGPGAVVTRAVVGSQASVGPGARLVGSVLGPGAELPAGAAAAAALVPGPPGRRASPPRAGTPRPGAGSPGGGA
jgi:mannose-1-phosphate guanylyltransferase